MKLKKFLLLFSLVFFLSILSTSLSLAEESKIADVVLSNSNDWKDVYSSMLYASLVGADGRFLTSTRHGTIILASIPKDKKILVITPKQQSEAYVVGYKSILDARGYDAQELILEDPNIDLGKLLEDVTNFIVVDPSYGYNAIAVAPYAVKSRSWVLFADRTNIGKVEKFLSSRKVDKLLIYGHVDRAVRDVLSKYNPEIIDKGDRFENNIEIVKKYLEINPRKQVILTSGEFIEKSIMSGDDPVLFLGKQNVPDVVRKFINQSDFVAAVLIGNELIGTATFIRRQIGISVFVKFAQSARVPAGTISAVEDLDRFWLPRYQLNLTVYAVNYNKATNSIEVTYSNNGDLPIYLKGTITITTDTGQRLVVGDEEPVFIDKKEFKTLVYELPEPLEGSEINAEIYTIFGEGRKSLEFVLEVKVKVNLVEIEDNSQVDILDLAYSKSKKGFYAVIENVGDVDAYVDVELVDLVVDNQLIDVSSEGTAFVKAHGKKKVFIPIELSEEDIEANQLIKVHLIYGERENFLIKQLYKEFEFKYYSESTGLYVFALVVVLILILLYLYRGKKCKHCGTRNAINARRCRSCMARI